MKPIVKITWLDACSASGWRTEPTAPSVNYTVGYEVYNDLEYVEVACTYDPDSGCWNGSISIPQDNIVTYECLENKPIDVEITFESE